MLGFYLEIKLNECCKHYLSLYYFFKDIESIKILEVGILIISYGIR